MISSSTICELPLATSQEMSNKFNGEVFLITLNVQPSVEIILEIS